MPNSESAVNIATAHTILLPALYNTPASVRVCCSRLCATRDCDAAGRTSSFVSTRSSRFNISAMIRIAARCNTFASEKLDQVVKGLDIIFMRERV